MKIENLIEYGELLSLVKFHLGLHPNELVTLRVLKEGIYAHYNNGVESFISVFELVDLLSSSKCANNTKISSYIDEGFMLSSDLTVNSEGYYWDVQTYVHKSNASLYLVKDTEGMVISGKFIVRSPMIRHHMKRLVKCMCVDFIGDDIMVADAEIGVYKLLVGVSLALGREWYLPLEFYITSKSIEVECRGVRHKDFYVDMAGIKLPTENRSYSYC